MKNLEDYNKKELINIAEQLTVPKAGLANCSNKTLIAKIEEKASKLGVSIPEPIAEEEKVNPTEEVKQAKKKRKINEYPRKTIILECKDSSIKQQHFSINEYTGSLKVGEEIPDVPEPVIEFLKSLKSTIHVVGEDGNVKPKDVSRFYINIID